MSEQLLHVPAAPQQSYSTEDVRAILSTAYKLMPKPDQTKRITALLPLVNDSVAVPLTAISIVERAYEGSESFAIFHYTYSDTLDHGQLVRALVSGQW